MPTVWIATQTNKNGKNHIVRWAYFPKGPDGKKIIGKNKKPLRIFGSESCGPSKRYASERKEEILEDVYAGRPVRPRVKFKMVGEFIDECLANSEKTKAANTLNNFERPALTSFRNWFGSKKPLAAIDRAELMGWRDDMLDAEYSANTVRMRLRDLNTALSYAKEMGYIQENPFDTVKRKTLFPQAAEVARYISNEEIDKLLPALPPHIARACYFILHTGLRHGELLNLDWKMIHQPAKGPWTMEITRASAHGIQTGHQTKTRNARIVEIPDNARIALGEPKTEGKVVEWSTRDVIESNLRAARERLKLGRIRTHDFRHTWATNFMYRTGNAFELMYRGGWRSMNSAAVYQHIRKREEIIEYRPFAQYVRSNARFRMRAV
jgi:integrase